jgi:hypothetical protein
MPIKEKKMSEDCNYLECEEIGRYWNERTERYYCITHVNWDLKEEKMNIINENEGYEDINYRNFNKGEENEYY